MHRTQIYFDEILFQDIKNQANILGVSLSSYIRKTIKKDLETKKNLQKEIDFSSFSGMWEDRDITQDNLRKKAWK